MSADGLPPLREIIARHELRARKELGQNFLLDLNLTGKIARAAGPLKNATIIEVGPGPGGLTRALLHNGARHVIAIERDRRCIAALEEIAAHYPGRLTIIEGDALKTDFVTLANGENDVRIAANLPYNIGTQLLLNWVATEKWPPFWQSMTLMFQKEVAARIVASPGDDAYGRLSVMMGWRTQASIMFDVPRQAFTPEPNVTSAIVRLEPLRVPIEAPLHTMERITQAAFGQRRKMLRQSLKPLGGEDLLSRAGIEPTRRAETLSVEEFASLARAWEASG